MKKTPMPPRVVRGLLRVAWYELRSNAWPPSRRRRSYRVVGALFGVALWWALFRGVSRAVSFLVSEFPGIDAVVPQTVELLCFVLFFALVYSGVLVTLGRVFLADSLRLVGALPAQPGSFFWSYWVQVSAAAGWMPFAFGSAVLGGVGHAVGVAPLYYVVLFVGLLAFVVVSVTLSLIGTTGIATLLPASRAKDVLIVLSLVSLTGLFVIVRSLRPEKLMKRRAAEQLADALITLETPGGGVLPSNFLSDALTPMLSGQLPGGAALTLLLGCTALLAVVGYGVFSVSFSRARSRALSARGQWLSGESVVKTLVWRLTAPLPQGLSALTRKDLLHLGRDATQWSQLLLIAGLAVIYLFNISALPLDEMRTVGTTRARAADAIAIVNLLPAGFVLAAVALRFVYAAISLEGRAAWISLSAPSGILALVAAKIAIGFPILLSLGILLALGTNHLVTASPGVAGVSVGAVVLMALALTGLGAGLGVMQPNFRADHPTQVVTSLGGFAFMGAAIFFLCVFVPLCSAPAILIHLWTVDGSAPEWLSWGAALGGVFAVIAALATAVVPLIFGLARIDSRKLEP